MSLGKYLLTDKKNYKSPSSNQNDQNEISTVAINIIARYAFKDKGQLITCLISYLITFTKDLRGRGGIS